MIFYGLMRRHWFLVFFSWVPDVQDTKDSELKFFLSFTVCFPVKTMDLGINWMISNEIPESS